eukprot:XP_020405717.1 uncharacterized protein LOC103649795 isoform X2 [Zea mays]
MWILRLMFLNPLWRRKKVLCVLINRRVQPSFVLRRHWPNTIRKRKPRKNSTKGWFPKDVPESSQPVDHENEDVVAMIPAIEDVVERPSSPPEERVVRVLVKKITPRKKNV